MLQRKKVIRKNLSVFLTVQRQNGQKKGTEKNWENTFNEKYANLRSSSFHVISNSNFLCHTFFDQLKIFCSVPCCTHQIKYLAFYLHFLATVFYWPTKASFLKKAAQGT